MTNSADPVTQCPSRHRIFTVIKVRIFYLDETAYVQISSREAMNPSVCENCHQSLMFFTVEILLLCLYAVQSPETEADLEL